MAENGSGCSVTTGGGVSHYWIKGPGINRGDVVTLREINPPYRTWQGTVKTVNVVKAIAQLRYLGKELADEDGVEEDRDGDLADVSVTVGGVIYPPDTVIVDPPGP